jgi:glycosyltransferase involved in cell wall biosynthesis
MGCRAPAAGLAGIDLRLSRHRQQASMSATPGIVLVTTSYPITGDGSEAAGAFVQDLAEEIARTLPVRVVAPGPVTAVEAEERGVIVHRYAAPGKPLSTLRPWHPADALAIARVMASGLATTRQAVHASPARRIVALWALPSGHWARKVARESGLPYDVWTLGSDIWSLGRIPGLRAWLGRVLREADRCFSDGLQLAEDTRAIARRPVEFLPSTRRITRRRELPPRDRAPYRLLFLGRWHPNKGIDLLLDALAMLDDDDWSRIESITIHGGGPMEPLVRDRVAALQASGRPMRLGGFLDKPAAEQAICEADWLLIPSRIESIPVVFSDAMKLGCPVIAMPVGDLPQLIAQGVGVLALAVDEQGIVGALRQALVRSATTFQAGLNNASMRFDLVGAALALGESEKSRA